MIINHISAKEKCLLIIKKLSIKDIPCF